MTPTPTPTPRPEFAVVAHTTGVTDQEYFLEELDVQWYLLFDADMTAVPEGRKKLPFISLPADRDVWTSGQTANLESLTDSEIADLGFLSRSQIRDLVQTALGSHWYVWGEPNRHGYITGARFAPVFHYLSSEIRLADPTAKIVGTSILNWDYTCIGCGCCVFCVGVGFLSGYQCGKDWFKEFIAEYESLYGGKPIVDAWAIDLYPLDWDNIPNNDPDKPALYLATGERLRHSSIVIQQIEGFRSYLDTIPDYVNTPIWITEIGIHVGFQAYNFDSQTARFTPVEPFRWDLMSDYLESILDWLDANASAKKIEKWFFLRSWSDWYDGDEDLGMIFFDGPSDGARLNCLGELYRARALGLPKVACDSQGNTVADE